MTNTTGSNENSEVDGVDSDSESGSASAMGDLYVPYDIHMPVGGDSRFFSTENEDLVDLTEDELATYVQTDYPANKAVISSQNSGSLSSPRTRSSGTKPGSSENTAGSLNGISSIDTFSNHFILSNSDSATGDHQSNHSKHGYEIPEELLAMDLNGYEPKIQPSVLKDLTNCPVPRLNLQNPTITSHIEWQIFVYCVLYLVPVVDSIPQYPEIHQMKHHKSALTFMRQMREKFLETWGNNTLLPHEKLALFEKIFIVTKLRTLTESEKTLITSLIESKGLDKAVKLYLVNWYLSNFYNTHFDFSKNPGGEFVSNLVSGQILNSDNSLVSGATFSIADPGIYGFFTRGVTGNSSLVSNLTGSPNFEMQFYLPKNGESNHCVDNDGDNHHECHNEHDDNGNHNGNENNPHSNSLSNSSFFNAIYSSGHHDEPEHGHSDHNGHDETDDDESDDEHFTSTYPVEISILVTHPDYAITLAKGIMTTEWLSNLVINLLARESLDPAQMWPTVSINTNNPFNSWSMNIDLNGNIGNCLKPDTDSAGLINADNWQKFAYCMLGFSSFDTQFGINYMAMNSKMAAFDYLYTMIHSYLETDMAIDFTAEQILTKMFQIITFTTPTPQQISDINSVLVNQGLEAAINMLLEAWYNSPSYSQYFDYTLYPYDAKTWYEFNGQVINQYGLPVHLAEVYLLNMSGQLVANALDNQRTTFQMPVYTDENGFFKLPVLLNSSDVEMPLTMELKAQNFSPVSVNVFPKLAGNFTITTDVTLLPIGLASSGQDSIIISPTHDIAISIPKGAVQSDTQFIMTDMTPVNITDSMAKTYEFSVEPSYQFNKPVKIEVQISDTLLTDLQLSASTETSGEEGLALFVKNNNQYELLAGISYNPETKTLRGETTHFSTFVIGKCGIIPCAPNNVIDAMATILDRQVIEYPSQLPRLKNEYRNTLDAGGWDASVIDSYILPSDCGNDTCPPITLDLTSQDFNLPVVANNSYVRIGSVEVLNAKLHTKFQADVQSEYCSINPTASIPQIRINNIPASHTDLEVTLKFNNVQINYPCLKTQYVCLGPICIQAPLLTTCTEPAFSHTASMTIMNYNQAVYKNNNPDGSITWSAGPTFSSGNINVNIPDSVRDNQIKKIYANGLNNILLSRQFENRAELNKKLNFYMNAQELPEPHFEQANCFESGAPTATITSKSNGDILSNVGGTFSNGSTIPYSTTIQWQSNRQGEYKILLNDTCDNYYNSTPIYSGTIAVNETVNTIITADHLSQNGINSIKVCLKDQWNSEIGQTVIPIYKTYVNEVCTTEQYTEPEYQCTNVQNQICNNVLVGQRHVTSCWYESIDPNAAGTSLNWCWCTPHSACYRNIYENQCSWVTSNECSWVNVIKSREVCEDHYWY
jgi:hypothetical protein